LIFGKTGGRQMGGISVRAFLGWNSLELCRVERDLDFPLTFPLRHSADRTIFAANGTPQAERQVEMIRNPLKMPLKYDRIYRYFKMPILKGIKNLRAAKKTFRQNGLKLGADGTAPSSHFEKFGLDLEWSTLKSAQRGNWKFPDACAWSAAGTGRASS
jgi:hypothetical protein